MTVERITDRDFEEITGHTLSNVSYLKMFPVLYDTEDNEYFIDIFRSYEIFSSTLIDTVYFNTYEAKNDDWWDSIAYSAFETPHLWWMVCLTNDITNPYEELIPGQNLKILNSNYIPQLVREIRAMGDL